MPTLDRDLFIFESREFVPTIVILWHAQVTWRTHALQKRSCDIVNP